MVSTTVQQNLPPELEITSVDRLFPIAILAERTTKIHNESVLQWLIQWKDRSIEEATWEDALVIKSQFPDAILEDKTLVEGRSNDTEPTIMGQKLVKPTIFNVYSRRPKRVERESG